MQYLDAVSKRTEWSQFISKANHSLSSNPSLCSNHWCGRSWSWTVLWRPKRPSRTNTKQRCPFHHRGLECKSRKSRDILSNRKVWPWNKMKRCKSYKILPREHTGHSKHSLPTTQEMTLHMDITRKSIPKSDWLYSLQLKMDKLYSQQKQDLELAVAQFFRSLLKNSGSNRRK